MNATRPGWCWSDSWTLAYKVYITTLLSLVGLLVNTVFIVTFVRFLRNTAAAAGTKSSAGPQSQVFKYLLVKSFNDSIQFLLLLFSPLYFASVGLSGAFWMQVWFKWLYNYLESVCEMSSGLLTIAAALDVLLTILNRGPLFRRACFFYLATGLTYAFSFSFSTYHIFRFRILPVAAVSYNSTLIAGGYVVQETEFAASGAFDALQIANGLFRDALVIVVLSVENVLILRHFRRSMKNKKRLAIVTTLLKVKNSFKTGSKQRPPPPAADSTLIPATTSTTTNETEAPKKKRLELSTIMAAKSAAVAKSERKTTTMITVNGLFYIFGHSLGFVQACLVPKTAFASCVLADVAKVMYFSTCIFPILLFIRSNKTLSDFAWSSLTGCCCLTSTRPRAAAAAEPVRAVSRAPAGSN